MNLATWRQKKNLTMRQLAPIVGMSYSTIRQYLSGVKGVSRRQAVVIEHATQGQVTRTEAMWPELTDPKWYSRHRKESASEARVD